MDLKNEYQLIRIAAGDQWKTAVHGKEELFKYIVMPFRLTNTSRLLRESYILVYELVVMGLIAVGYIRVGRTGVIAYSIRIKLS